MKIVTYNLRMENQDDGPHRFSLRRDAILRRIRAERPDILGFQEALPEMKGFLEEQLSEYTFVGHGRSEAYSDEATPVAFLKSRFDLRRYETFWLSPTPGVPGSRFLEDQSICPRVCVFAELHDRQTGGDLRIFNTHLDHEGPIARKRGLELILKRLDREEPGVPTVVMGDLNCPPTDPALGPLQARLRDMTAHIALTFHAFQGYYPWKQDKIDYIFVSGEIRGTRCGIWANGPDGVCLSDHYPVCLETEA